MEPTASIQDNFHFTNFFFLVHLLNTENNVVAFCKKKYVHYIRTDILHRVQPTHTLQKYEFHAWGNVPMNCFKIYHTTFIRIRKPVRSFLCFYSFHQAYISHFWRVILYLSTNKMQRGRSHFAHSFCTHRAVVILHAL